jgi:hypothetical protein
MNKGQVMRALAHHSRDSEMADCAQSLLDAFYEQMKDKLYTVADVYIAFTWFKKGWGDAAKRLRN